MRNFFRAKLSIGIIGLMRFASAPRTIVVAHEGHRVECEKPIMQAINVDIQAMNDGEAKTKAMKEMKMAEEMMGKKNMKGCVAHMHNAMEAIEK
jgi:hypothetical protein